ncbi:MAG: HNH endonuclease [Selenomonas sp.]|nr:HNH endonuclease [Selenomonas sp.]
MPKRDEGKDDVVVSNVSFTFSDDGKIAYGHLPDGIVFQIDTSEMHKIEGVSFYRNYRDLTGKILYVIDRHGKHLHRYLIDAPKGYEIDHINLDTMDNRLCNLRICTHQQNQCNQPLQRNNTSGVTGVRFHRARNKFQARIKVCQHSIHLGYYMTFEEAVQARNVGMKCMFGEFGRYNDVAPAPKWIREDVINRCKRFVDLSICESFVSFVRKSA